MADTNILHLEEIEMTSHSCERHNRHHLGITKSIMKNRPNRRFESGHPFLTGIAFDILDESYNNSGHTDGGVRIIILLANNHLSMFFYRK